MAFDSNENEVIRLAEKYGKNDKDFPNKKVLFKKINTNIKKENEKYIFIFDIDRQKEKIQLCIFDDNGELLEKEAYITFYSIKKHLYTKLKKIAYIKASVKNIEEEKFYRYYSIFLYKLKSFDVFLELIEKNKLEIQIVSRINKSGQDIGKYRNKNIEFSIEKSNIPLLFECYYQYDYDRKY